MAETLAPALESGLTILELLAQARKPVGFNAIDAQVPVSRATTARLLKVLQSRGWLQKEPGGKYLLGPEATKLMQVSAVPEALRIHSTRILPKLVEESGNTCLLVHWDGHQMECLNKETNIGSVPMQPIGATHTDLSRAPWGWIIYDGLDKEQKKRAEKELEHAAIFAKHYPAWIEYYHKHGFTYDDQQFYTPIRRLGAPVFDASGNIVGGLGMGGNPLTMKNGQVKKLGGLLTQHAKRLSTLLGWSENREAGGLGT